MDVILRLLRVKDKKAALKYLVDELSLQVLTDEITLLFSRLVRSLGLDEISEAMEHAQLVLVQLQQKDPVLTEQLLTGMTSATSIKTKVMVGMQYITQFAFYLAIIQALWWR